MKKIISLCLGGLLLLSAAACTAGGENSSSSGENNDKPVSTNMTDCEFTLSQLSGTDALGRKITAASDRKKNKYVGIYYFLWFGYHTHRIYDTSKILLKYENGIVGNPLNPLWEVDPSAPSYDESVSPNGEFHYWSEPLYGYYNSEDPWIARKHLELLSFADVDYLLLDYTNGFIYENATFVLINAILEMQAEGWKVPKIAFMLPIDPEKSISTFENIYNKYLSVSEYADAFFRADEETNPSGKPLVTGSLDGLDANKLRDVWYKPLQWPGRPYDDKALPWIDWAPKNIQHNHGGTMCVSIAQHSGGAWSSDPYLYPGKQFFRGRGWVPSNSLDNGADENNVMSGTNFQFQWDNVFDSEEEVDTVIVTGWNEWIAQKQSTLENTFHTSLRAVFVDSFNMAYSRDAEMMAGGYGDNYWMQLVKNIRTFKYGDAETAAVDNEKATIDISEGISAWTKISNVYLDADGEVTKRNFISVDPALKYVNDSARNDVVSLKFANDGENLYIRVETKSAVTAHEAGDNSWMNVYISTGASDGWENYNYIVNREPSSDGTTSVEKFSGEILQSSGTARYFVQGNYIFYEIPMSALNIRSADQIGIKITDNILTFKNIDAFYTDGECAPIGRLNYTYKLA